MKTALQLNVGQHLTLTPQLQQAIRLLQLSSLELEQEVQEALTANMMLERVESENTAEETSISAENEWQTSANESENTKETASDETDNLDTSYEEETLSATDFITGISYDNEASNTEKFLKEHTNLHEYLHWQIRLTPLTQADQFIGYAIIDAIGDDGFLTCSLEEIHTGLQKTINTIELDEVEAVLKIIQNFDPPGVGARDVKECLLIQLNQLPENTPWLKQAKELVTDHLPLIAQRNFKNIQRFLKINDDELKEVLGIIRSLNPHPGYTITSEETPYVIPDLIVKKTNQKWTVELNQEAIPHVRINRQYAALIERANHSPSHQLLRSHLQEARWFIKSLQSRHETLLKVARCILDYQYDFFEQGEEAMKPLVLHEIAEKIGMHESTISRVTTQKYMMTPRGLFELKYFFSSHVDTANGGECSATAIRAFIKKLIAQENAHHPLSDNSIAQSLRKQGIQVARRTIAKYRESMSIPPSNERKSL